MKCHIVIEARKYVHSLGQYAGRNPYLLRTAMTTCSVSAARAMCHRETRHFVERTIPKEGNYMVNEVHRLLQDIYLAVEKSWVDGENFYEGIAHAHRLAYVSKTDNYDVRLKINFALLLLISKGHLYDLVCRSTPWISILKHSAVKGYVMEKEFFRSNTLSIVIINQGEESVTACRFNAYTVIQKNHSINYITLVLRFGQVSSTICSNFIRVIQKA